MRIGHTTIIDCNKASIFRNLCEIERYAVANKVSQFQTDEERKVFLGKYAEKLWQAVTDLVSSEDQIALAAAWDVRLGCASISGYVRARQESVKPILPTLVPYTRKDKRIPGPKSYKAIETLFASRGLEVFAIEPESNKETLFVYCTSGIYELKDNMFQLVLS